MAIKKLPILLILFVTVILYFSGCSATRVKKMEVTAYCGCGQCCGWERGSWKYLKIDQWNRYISAGPQKGLMYSGNTASGKKPVEQYPGLFSMDSIKRPWMIPVRIVFFPWLLPAKDGTIAADTKYYPFGTRMYIPGYGYGVVEDRGSAIKGPGRIDIYYESHGDALKWGREKIKVEINP